MPYPVTASCDKYSAVAELYSILLATPAKNDVASICFSTKWHLKVKCCILWRNQPSWLTQQRPFSHTSAAFQLGQWKLQQNRACRGTAQPAHGAQGALQHCSVPSAKYRSSTVLTVAFPVSTVLSGTGYCWCPASLSDSYCFPQRTAPSAEESLLRNCHSFWTRCQLMDREVSCWADNRKHHA